MFPERFIISDMYRTPLSAYSIFMACLTTLVVSLFVFIYLSFFPASTHDKSYVLHIPHGSNINTITHILSEKHLIHSKRFFKLIIRVMRADRKLRAGYFLIPPSINQQSLIHILINDSGSHNLTKITIPEGFSIAQIAARLESHNICDKDDFESFAHVHAKLFFKESFPFLADIPKDTIEGYLFPETYFFQESDSPKTVIKQMLIEFEKNIYTPFKDANKSYAYSFHKLLTLASMIQKESRKLYEMPQISSVFYNRIKKRMYLASDPTVVYALGKSYKDRVYYKDLEIKSPYNTYRRLGFPPTPIASPGVKAFSAACNPNTTPFLFFVAKPDGSHHFSKTYDEHLEIQRIMKRKKKSQKNPS